MFKFMFYPYLESDPIWLAHMFFNHQLLAAETNSWLPRKKLGRTFFFVAQAVDCVAPCQTQAELVQLWEKVDMSNEKNSVV